MGSVVINKAELFGDKRIAAQIERLSKKVLIPNLAEIWPSWEKDFDEALENEKTLGSQKALEILKTRCPFSLESNDEAS